MCAGKYLFLALCVTILTSVSTAAALNVEPATIQDKYKATSDADLLAYAEIVAHENGVFTVQITVDTRTKPDNVTKSTASNIPLSVCSTKGTFDNVSFLSGTSKSSQCLNQSIAAISGKQSFNVTIASKSDFLNANFKLGNASELIVFQQADGFWINTSYYRWFILKAKGTPSKVFPSNDTTQISEASNHIIRYYPFFGGDATSAASCDIVENVSFYMKLNCYRVNARGYSINYTFYETEGEKAGAIFQEVVNGTNYLWETYGFLTAGSVNRLTYNGTLTNYSVVIPAPETGYMTWGWMAYYLNTKYWTVGWAWTQNNTNTESSTDASGVRFVLGTNGGSGNYNYGIRAFVIHSNESGLSTFANSYYESMVVNDLLAVSTTAGTFKQLGAGSKSNVTGSTGINGYEVNATTSAGIVSGWINRSLPAGVFVHVFNDTSAPIWYIYNQADVLIGWLNYTANQSSNKSVADFGSNGDFYIRGVGKQNYYFEITNTTKTIVPPALLLTYVSPTENDSAVSYKRYLYVNLTVNDTPVTSCILSYWDEDTWRNETMTITGSYCYLRTSKLSNGYYEYKVYVIASLFDAHAVADVRAINKAWNKNFFMEIAAAVFRFFWFMGAVWQ